MTGAVYITSTTPQLYTCTSTDTWTAVAWTGTLPSGAIIFVASGACPSSYTEVSGLNGRLIRGTLNANGDVGGTGGSDTYTPAGTNGTVNFTPAGTNAAITAGTPAGTISALTTGADSSTTGGVAKAIAQTPTFTGSALATHNHTFTGTQGSVPAETFTGTQATVIPAYMKLIACSKN